MFGDVGENLLTIPGFLADHPENLHPKTPEIDELGQGLFNACLTFKIGSVLVKLQLGKNSNKLKMFENFGNSPDFLFNIHSWSHIVFKSCFTSRKL